MNRRGAKTQPWLLMKVSISEHGASIPVDIPDLAGAIHGGRGHEVPAGVPEAGPHSAGMAPQGQDAAVPRQVPDPHCSVTARCHQLGATAQGIKTGLSQERGEEFSSKII